MVLLHVKKSGDQQFLYEVPADTQVADILQQVVQINNLRAKIQLLSVEVEQLCRYGPTKPILRDVEEPAEPYEQQQTGTEDPQMGRTGNVCPPEIAETLQRLLAEAISLQHKDQMGKKIPLSAEVLMEALDRIQEAVLQAYPEGLPDSDPVKLALTEIEGLSDSHQTMQASDAELWFASKRLLPDKKLSQYVGKNEKTKVVVKLLQAGSGPPMREAGADEETQKAMLAYYYKKQEAQKRLAQDDTHYYDSAWANPQSLKNHFTGISNVKLA